jgi:serpin B
MAEGRATGLPTAAGNQETGEAARADDLLGADLLGALAQPGKDAVYSPASIAAVLRMLLLGARGETAGEIAAALHLAGRAEAAAGLRLLSSGLDQLESGDLTLRTPNTMWVQAGMPLVTGFERDMTGLGRASLHRVSFGAPQRVRQQINELIEEQTAGKITNLLQPRDIGSDTRLVLANAVYLKAAWRDPFNPASTREEPFHTADGERLPVQMMELAKELGYLRGDGYQAVLLPYTGGRLALAVILPDGPLAPCEAKLARGGTAGLLAGAAARQVRLKLPKFRQQMRLDLKPVLGRLGIGAAFGGGADFTGITTADALQVGAAKHMAYIDVDEQGTEAAAATAVTMRALALRVTPPPVEVTVNRPFLYAIIDRPTSLPLFLGRVTRPGRGQGTL